MRSLAFLALVLSLAAAAFPTKEVLVATPELLTEALPQMHWQSVGLVLIRKTKKQRSYATGFFISPTLFAFLDSPFIQEVSKACAKPTYIFTGKMKVVPDFDLKTEPPNFQCKRVVKNHVWNGFEVWEVEPLGGAQAPPPIPLLTKAIADEVEFDREGERTSILGYAFTDEGAELKLVSGCRYKHVDSPFTPQDIAEKADLAKVRFDWSTLDCPLEDGMQGGPILARVGKVWMAVGVATGSVDGVRGKLILTPYFPRVSELFEKIFQEKKQ